MRTLMDHNQHPPIQTCVYFDDGHFHDVLISPVRLWRCCAERFGETAEKHEQSVIEYTDRFLLTKGQRDSGTFD